MELYYHSQNRVLTNASIGIESDRLRQIRLHERVNELPDPNYATLKYFMGHLHKYTVQFVDIARDIVH